VKPFLPGMLDQDLAIRIPTPITAHLDNCKECSEDLESIRKLALSRKNLCHLSQLFAEVSIADVGVCEKAKHFIPSAVAMIFSEIGTEVLRHLCICPYCRRFVYERREAVRKGLLHGKRIQKEFPCEQVPVDDIFDYVIPYGVDPTNDRHERFRESLTSHLRTCPTCLAKMQQLHKTVYRIADRAESDVVTIYHLDDSAKEKALSDSTDTYAGFPIRVEVIKRDDKARITALQPVPTISFTAILKQRILTGKFKTFAKTAVAAAAVILLATALFLSMPTAKAVTIKQIYEAIDRVKNIHISKFIVGKSEPEQEKWISKTYNFYMMKTEKLVTLWDINNEVIKDKSPDTGQVEVTPLTPITSANVKKQMSGSLGLMPFYNMSEIPADAKWTRVTENTLELASEDIEVYDLTWPIRRFGGSLKLLKWRIFVTYKTYLPRKIELYEKIEADDEYILQRITKMEYLSDNQIQLVLEEASF
jgi:hypothetical protein